ncbi:hypothetical protein H0H81_012025 [Sphagnurus paluster]|uniref:Uncharacterized protein n=1 Tax=Sphagnurus paluster TaxID=117069 RepID=A0A9P7FQM2_9AGAR|nr:hypothetical protein H0H81_012025 [Sphagnurus paluster]
MGEPSLTTAPHIPPPSFSAVKFTQLAPQLLKRFSDPVPNFQRAQSATPTIELQYPSRPCTPCDWDGAESDEVETFPQNMFIQTDPDLAVTIEQNTFTNDSIAHASTSQQAILPPMRQGAVTRSQAPMDIDVDISPPQGSFVQEPNSLISTNDVACGSSSAAHPSSSTPFKAQLSAIDTIVTRDTQAQLQKILINLELSYQINLIACDKARRTLASAQENFDASKASLTAADRALASYKLFIAATETSGNRAPILIEGREENMSVRSGGSATPRSIQPATAHRVDSPAPLARFGAPSQSESSRSRDNIIGTLSSVVNVPISREVEDEANRVREAWKDSPAQQIATLTGGSNEQITSKTTNAERSASAIPSSLGGIQPNTGSVQGLIRTTPNQEQLQFEEELPRSEPAQKQRSREHDHSPSIPMSSVKDDRMDSSQNTPSQASSSRLNQAQTFPSTRLPTVTQNGDAHIPPNAAFPDAGASQQGQLGAKRAGKQRANIIVDAEEAFAGGLMVVTLGKKGDDMLMAGQVPRQDGVHRKDFDAQTSPFISLKPKSSYPVMPSHSSQVVSTRSSATSPQLHSPAVMAKGKSKVDARSTEVISPHRETISAPHAQSARRQREMVPSPPGPASTPTQHGHDHIASSNGDTPVPSGSSQRSPLAIRTPSGANKPTPAAPKAADSPSDKVLGKRPRVDLPSAGPSSDGLSGPPPKRRDFSTQHAQPSEEARPQDQPLPDLLARMRIPREAHGAEVQVLLPTPEPEPEPEAPPPFTGRPWQGKYEGAWNGDGNPTYARPYVRGAGRGQFSRGGRGGGRGNGNFQHKKVALLERMNHHSE